MSAGGIRRLIAGTAVIGAVLGMAACSSQQPPAASGRSPSSPAAPAGPSAATSTTAGAALTGTQLDSALAPASSFPGFTVNTQDAYEGGTGAATLPAQYDLATMSCTRFSQQLLFATWFGQTAIAWAHFDHATGGPMTATYDEFIYQFRGDSAAGSFIQALRSAFGRCQSYSDVEGGVNVRTTFAVADVAPVGGGQSMQVTVTATASVGTVSGVLLYVLSGNCVYGVVRAGPPTGVPASPAASAVIQGMMTHVQAMTR